MLFLIKIHTPVNVSSFEQQQENIFDILMQLENFLEQDVIIQDYSMLYPCSDDLVSL